MKSENREKQTSKRAPPRSAWQPGQSGNPGGRPKVAAEVRDLARKYGAKAIERLATLMNAKNGPVAVRAAEAILDRGYGRSRQAQEEPDPIKPSARWRDFSKLSQEEYETLLRARDIMKRLDDEANGTPPSPDEEAI